MKLTVVNKKPTWLISLVRTTHDSAQNNSDYLIYAPDREFLSGTICGMRRKILFWWETQVDSGPSNLVLTCDWKTKRWMCLISTVWADVDNTYVKVWNDPTKILKTAQEFFLHKPNDVQSHFGNGNGLLELEKRMKQNINVKNPCSRQSLSLLLSCLLEGNWQPACDNLRFSSQSPMITNSKNI